MRIAISGINGFIGSHLRLAMQQKGWDVIPLERKDFSLDPVLLGVIITGVDVILHLTGAPIVHHWNKAYKQELRNSRIGTTRKLVEAISCAKEKPGLFISTSAIGIYADEVKQTESRFKYADDFISKLCQDWESEANAASSITRTIIFRFGIVLARDGGAFPKMALPFRLGFGGKIGNGKQGFSWIHLDDLIAAFIFVIENKRINGVINLTSPEPADNASFTQTLSGLMRLPAIFSVPAFVIKLIYGEGSLAVLGGQKVFPERLITEGFRFKFPTLESALSDIIKK
jgi:uncharacterized protein